MGSVSCIQTQSAMLRNIATAAWCFSFSLTTPLHYPPLRSHDDDKLRSAPSSSSGCFACLGCFCSVTADLKQGRDGTQCPRRSARSVPGTPSGRTSRGCSTCHRTPPDLSRLQAPPGRSHSRSDMSNTNLDTTHTHSHTCHTTPTDSPHNSPLASSAQYFQLQRYWS